MKKYKLAGTILFWLTLISPLLSFALASLIGETDIFGIGGIVRYSWVMLLFIPIGILSIIIGIILKKGNQKYKKNLIIAIICIPLLLVFGSYRFIFSNYFSYNIDNVTAIEEITNLDLPNNVKSVTTKIDTYNVSYLKILDEEERANFENELETNEMWQTELSSEIKTLLPEYVRTEVSKFDNFVFYNLTNNEYNVCPTNGESKCVFIAYNSKQNRLIILDDYVVTIS